MAYRRNGAAVAFASVALPAIDTEREFDFTDADFQSLVKLAHEHAGLSLAESKRNLVYSRLSRRLRTLGLRSFQDYRDYLAANSAELESFINAISTNLTKFFREAHHFEHLRTHVAAGFAQTSVRRSSARLRIWSAGCSTGEEPYTIAAVLKREIPDIHRYDARILATDIDTEVIAKARAANIRLSR
jgi:chemotaxis protein methyltransferase CheR